EAVATGSHVGLNITTMCLDRWQTEEMKDQPALIWEGEDGTTKIFTYAELLDEVEKCAVGLKLHKLTKGSTVGIHLPMIPETIIALLAINRIGAIAVPFFSGYGIDAIVSRMNAVRATAIFTSSGFPRRGKMFDSFSVAKEVVLRLNVMAALEKGKYPDQPFVQNVFGVGEFDESDTKDVAGFVAWDQLLERCHLKKYLRRIPEPTSAEDPLIILYTSGTTGKPKGIAHTHASFPIKAAQDMAFGTDVGRGTRISWYTDIGWMMGPWLIYGALINGATICIYDGAPDYPTHDRMWEFCAKHKVEILGISPTLVRALAAYEESSATAADATGEQASRLLEGGARDNGDDSKTQGAASPSGDVASETLALQSVGDPTRKAPYQRHDLSALRAFASTGEPWNPAPWWWLFEKVGNSKLPIINYSGGTEISGGILMGNPLLPIKPCSFPAPCPGMHVDIFDENGQSVGPNQVGELVIKQPWIGMARGFWQERERYLDTYWRRFPNTWVHGDWAMRDKDGHWFILGRSDDTLKVAGKRVGPAEVESLLVAHPLVSEAAVIGVPDEAKGTAMVAFCVLSAPPKVADATGAQASRLHEGEVRKGSEGGSPQAATASETLALQSELKGLVARDMGKPLAPSKIHFVSALPKTRNAKVMRRVIRSAYLGADPGDLSALENPSAVEEIRTALVAEGDRQ
ncbi:MAG TPA: AMP-binding protein, partial [Pyrinomonadaceae bacterium]|nr:AMP-binding protein [Pyrinomonadaceae bacterium]